MADSTLLALTQAADLDGSEEIYGVQSAADRKFLTSQLAAYMGGLPDLNFVLNGAMEVSQENGTTAKTLGGSNYIVDMFGGGFSATSRAFQGQKVASGLANFPSCCQMKATTGGAIGGTASDYAFMYTFIEGYRFAPFGFGAVGAKTVNIGIMVRATIAGTLAVSLQNGAGTRSYVTEVTINSPNTWEWKTISIPGDTAGIWNTDNTIGAELNFGSLCGTTFRATANTWSAGDFISTASTTNFFATTNNVVQITGVIVTPYDLPSAAQARRFFRPFDQELILCQRYWEKSYDYAQAPGDTSGTSGLLGILITGLASAGNTIVLNGGFKVRKRTFATMIFYSKATGASGKFRDYNANADVTAAVYSVGEQGFQVQAVSGVGTGIQISGEWAADARF